jgi:hypothetical protein
MFKCKALIPTKSNMKTRSGMITIYTQPLKYYQTPPYWPTIKEAQRNVKNCQSKWKMIENISNIFMSIYRNNSSYQVRMLFLTISETLRRYPFFIDCDVTQELLHSIIRNLELLNNCEYFNEYIQELKKFSDTHVLDAKRKYIKFIFTRSNVGLDIAEKILTYVVD